MSSPSWTDPVQDEEIIAAVRGQTLPVGRSGSHLTPSEQEDAERLAIDLLTNHPNCCDMP